MSVTRWAEPSPRLAVVILALALALPFAVVVAFSIVTTLRLAVTAAVVLPLLAGLTMISAAFAVRHYPADAPARLWAGRARSISRITLLVYSLLLLPAVLIGVAGQG